jgi:hypothetical protein
VPEALDEQQGADRDHRQARQPADHAEVPQVLQAIVTADLEAFQQLYDERLATSPAYSG